MAVDSPHFATQQILMFGGGIVEGTITNLFTRWAEVSFEFGFLTLLKLTIFGGNLVWNSSVISPCFMIRNLEISKETVFFDAKYLSRIPRFWAFFFAVWDCINILVFIDLML